MWLLKLWRKLFPVREVLVYVAKGFETPAADGDLDKDPRFLREMAESLRAAPVVYENMNNMLKKRLRLLAVPLPTTTQAERDTAQWRKDQAATEADVLRTLLTGPAMAGRALHDLANHKKEVQSNEHTNWAEERTAQ